MTEGTNATFTVTATPAPASATSVSVVVSEETSGGQDFVASAQETTHTVSIPTSGTATLTIPTVGDSTEEPHGAVTAVVQTGTGYTVGTPWSAMVTVNDDDADTTPPRVTSITRQTPSSSPTNADELTWRVTFNEAVQNVNPADFVTSGNGSPDLWALVTQATRVGNTNAYDVTVSGDAPILQAWATWMFSTAR